MTDMDTATTKANSQLTCRKAPRKQVTKVHRPSEPAFKCRVDPRQLATKAAHRPSEPPTDGFKKEIDDLLNSVNLYKSTLSYLGDYKLKKDYFSELVNTKDLSETKLKELKLKIVG